MRTLFHTATLLLSAVSLLQAAEPAPRPSGTGIGMIPENTGHPTTQVITDDELAARRNAAAGSQGRPKAIPPIPTGFGLLEMSTVLQSGGNYILLPKGSVLWCPPALQLKIVAAPTAKFSEWLSFLSVNRSWITTFEVTPEQVSGKMPLPADVTTRFRKGDSLIVATLQGGPISMPAGSP